MAVCAQKLDEEPHQRIGAHSKDRERTAWTTPPPYPCQCEKQNEQQSGLVELHRVYRQRHEGARQLRWDELVLATGARARRLPGQPNHPRVRSFHRWDDLEPLLEGLRRGQIGRVAVVGAGLVGCELAEAFTSLWGAEVTLVEAGSTPLPELLDPEVGVDQVHRGAHPGGPSGHQAEPQGPGPGVGDLRVGDRRVGLLRVVAGIVAHGRVVVQGAVGCGRLGVVGAGREG